MINYKAVFWKIAASFAAVGILMLFSGDSEAKIRSKSVWHITNTNTISTRDLMGNSMSVVCNNRTIDFYFSTNVVKFNRTERAYVKIWADKDNKVETFSRPVARKSTRVRISDYGQSSSLINDMKNKYDLSVLMKTASGDDIIMFALDGFSGKISRVCGI